MTFSESIQFHRSETERLMQHLASGHSFLLFGARQTGKTTLIHQILSAMSDRPVLRYYFQLPNQREQIERDPEVLRREVEALKSDKPPYLFIDEIQKIPGVMDVLQYLIDQKKIILTATGSSARKMRRLGVNWLPGRVRLEHLYPLTWQETAGRLSLSDLLRFGGLPGVLSENSVEQREQTLSAYTHLYLEEEIRLEATVRNIPRFTQFLRLAALESGGSPNLSKLGNQVGISHTSIREYFQILEDTLIVHRLNAFGGKRDAVLRSPKYYFFDIGVRNAAAQIGHSPGILTLQAGLLFEHFIILQAVALWKSRAQLYYWRTKKGEEVALVVEGKSDLIPIEAKHTDRPSAQDFAGLIAFQKKYKTTKGYLICQVEKPQSFGAFTALSYQDMASLKADL
ncbi:ATP-binding protein [Deltaproteobacteria bacterium PRO3]|nr:ATP-binding protein [Deltaproteobacteria bacterium PRO3]